MVTRTDGEAVQEGQGAADDLDAVIAEAGALENAPGEAAQAVQVQQKKQDDALISAMAGEIAGGLQMLRGMVLPMLPDHKARRLADVWTDGVLQNSAVAGAAIMHQQGWKLSEAMGKYGPWAMLVGVLAGPVIQTTKIMAEPEPEPRPVQEVARGE